jgi:hypothetical protein
MADVIPGPGDVAAAGPGCRYVSTRWIARSLGISERDVNDVLALIELVPIVNSHKEVLIPLLMFEMRMLQLHAGGFGIDCSDGKPKLVRAERAKEWLRPFTADDILRYSFVLVVADLVYSNAASLKLRQMLDAAAKEMVKTVQKESRAPTVAQAATKTGRKRGRPRKTYLDIPSAVGGQPGDR